MDANEVKKRLQEIGTDSEILNEFCRLFGAYANEGSFKDPGDFLLECYNCLQALEDGKYEKEIQPPPSHAIWGRQHGIYASIVSCVPMIAKSIFGEDFSREVTRIMETVQY